jgi:hypothetical protein
MGYCDVADLYQQGLPRGSTPALGRLVASVSTSANAFDLDGHDFVDGDAVRFRAELDGTLPAPIVEGTTYFVLAVDGGRFQVEATLGGGAINLSTAGLGVVVIADVPREAAIDWGAALIDDMMPSAVVPLTAPYPPVVVATNAELAIWKLSPPDARKAFADVLDGAQKRLARWARGVPVRGANAPAPADLSVASGAASAATDARGWRRFGGIA